MLLNDRVTGTDVFVSVLLNPNTGDVIDDSVFPLNDADGVVDTNPFNNDVMVLPVATAALTSMSKKAKSGNISYWVAAGTIVERDDRRDAEEGVVQRAQARPVHRQRPGADRRRGRRTSRGEQFFADLASSSHVQGADRPA